jgi:23S rRNA U2552 (ribose-2'-O)-methylase RlmE/FtsJ
MRLSAETWQGMAALMMNHIREKHPVVAQNMEEMTADPGEWSQEVKKEWDATPEMER